MCQNVAAVHITSQFHEFFNLIFGGFLSFETSVKRKRAQHLQNGETSLSKIDGCDLAKCLSQSHNGTNYFLESHFYFLRRFIFYS